MIIKPPDDSIQYPPYVDEMVYSTREYIENYIEVKYWTCPSCNLTNFGHNEYCADHRCRIKRPE